MSRNTSRVALRFAAGLTGAAGLLFLIFGQSAWVSADHQPNANILALPFKSDGAMGCNAANCHGAPAPNPPPKPAGNEYITWSEGKGGGDPDKHSSAFRTLTDPKT